jgi:Domain of unknown function (DUF3416)
VNIEDGRRRAVIERVSPEIDAGRFPIKRVSGETVRVEADIFADGHDTLCAVLKFRPGAALEWSEIRMEPLINDRWQASFLVAALGFDVLYLPPIHPIGRSFRKGKNNALSGSAEDPGSPWAIGAEEGGHKAVHPQLGSIEDFRHLVSTARSLGIEAALDIALQSSPDHPYVRHLDPHHIQRGWVTLPIDEWGLGPNASYQFHQLLTEARFLWCGPRNYVELDPQFVPAHILRLRR